MELIECPKRLLVLFETVFDGGRVKVDGDGLERNLFHKQDKAGGKESTDDFEDGTPVGGPRERRVANGENAAETDPRPGDAEDEFKVEGGGHESFDVRLDNLGFFSVDGDDESKRKRRDPVDNEECPATGSPDDGDPDAPDDHLSTGRRLIVGGSDDDEGHEADGGADQPARRMRTGRARRMQARYTFRPRLARVTLAPLRVRISSSSSSWPLEVSQSKSSDSSAELAIEPARLLRPLRASALAKRRLRRFERIVMDGKTDFGGTLRALDEGVVVVPTVSGGAGRVAVTAAAAAAATGASIVMVYGVVSILEILVAGLAA